MSDWQEIDSAPKDGRPLRLSWFEGGVLQEWFLMKWDANAENGLFPGIKGMWVAIDGSFTWNDHPTLGGGPTHWARHLQ